MKTLRATTLGGVDQFAAEFATLQSLAKIKDDQVAFIKFDFLKGLPGALSQKLQGMDPNTIDTCTKLYAAAKRFDDSFHALNPLPKKSPPRTRIAKLTPQERQRLLAEGRCFFCREAGHMATACPKKTQNRGLTTTNPPTSSTSTITDKPVTAPTIAVQQISTPASDIAQLRAIIANMSRETKEEAVRLLEEAGF